jgi:lipid-A-disaccharide synthase-like uncharacterized protein|tara:strand:+ start:90 stop:326 length:237 start_codon:yes stop_codon:yes gene_type:complete
MIIGIAGLVLLAIGWFSEVKEVIKQKKSKLDLKFSILYTIGSLCLVIYAIQLKDVIFFILNSVVTILSLISLIYSVKK